MERLDNLTQRLENSDVLIFPGISTKVLDSFGEINSGFFLFHLSTAVAPGREPGPEMWCSSAEVEVEESLNYYGGCYGSTMD